MQKRQFGFNTKVMMMLACIVLVAAVNITASAADNTTTVALTHTDITVTNNGETLSCTGADLSGKPGQPELPTYRRTVLLPPDADMASIQVSIRERHDSTLSGVYMVQPAAPPLVNGIEYWPDDTVIIKGKDNTVYSSNEYFPADNAMVSSIGKKWAYKLVEVEIFPYQYNPVTGKIKKLVSGTLTITYNRLRNEDTIALSAPSDVTRSVKDLVVNKSAVESDYTALTPTRASTYLIVTTATLQSSLSTLNTLIASKQRRGFTVKVITESDWGGGSGVDAALNIRQWLINNFQSLGIEYVLFIGHPVTGGVPMLRAYPDFSGRYQPYVDYCYADLSGNWDLNNDGKYAEHSKDTKAGGADKYAELHVGRIPYYGSISEVNALITKIVKYESEDKANIGWRYNAYLPMDPFDGGQNGITYGEAIRKNFLIPAGFTSFRVYDRSPGDLYPCSINTVVNAWNQDRYGVVFWQAHGLDDLAQNVMTTSSAALLNDDYPAHCYQLSCHNGKPEVSNNLGYAIFKNAAISTVAAAVQVLYKQSTTYGTGGSANDFGYMYAKYLVQEKLEAAKALNKTRDGQRHLFSTDWLNCIELNLYGCPAIGVYTAAGGGTFPTPTATPTATPTMTPTPTATPTATPYYKNIAPGKPVTASSRFSNAFPPEAAVDGSTNTAWGSSTNNVGQWIYIDLGTVTTVDGIGARWFDKYYANAYDVYYSNDLQTWTKLMTFTNTTGGYDYIYKTVSCRYVGLLLRQKNSIAYGLAEFEIYQQQ